MEFMLFVGGIAAVVVTVITSIMLRRVVPTNEVHIIQSGKTTTPYGKDIAAGNVYYEWPTWLPVIGVTKTILPVSVFKIELQSYDAYDTGRLPFEVDVVAFFRVSDFNTAAARISSFNDLKDQIVNIVRGAVRTVLASHDIDKIMLERSTFGTAFTEEVQEQLQQWGVVPVKNIELMDIRDGGQNQVIHNIMQKKKSLIEMQSRTEVAANMKVAQVAEIEAQRAVEVEKQSANQTIGLQSATREREVGIANQKAQQAIKDEEKATKEKEMAVLKVKNVQEAEINKQVNIVTAEAQKQAAILTAEGQLESQKRNAEGIQAQGLAKAEAEKAMQLAPVFAQTTLAKEIGSNENYQQYLISLKQIEANRDVGVEQAKAIEKANIKVIANSGDIVNGVTSARELFSSKGGTNLGAMLESFANTDVGKSVIDKLTK